MPSSHDRIKGGFDQLTEGLFPCVERAMKSVYGDRWIHAARESFRDERGGVSLPRGEAIRWDAHSLLTVMWDQWNRAFRSDLAPPDRSLISELRDLRNRWAHQERFGFDDAYRTLDSIERLLRAVDAGKQAEQVYREKRDLMREEYGRELRASHQRAEVRKKKIQDLSLYGLCCLSVLIAVFHAFEKNQWFIAGFAVAVFVYLAWQRLNVAQPIFFGAHECMKCTKIIYGESCPYCESRFSRPVAESPAVREQETIVAG